MRRYTFSVPVRVLVSVDAMDLDEAVAIAGDALEVLVEADAPFGDCLAGTGLGDFVNGMTIDAGPYKVEPGDLIQALQSRAPVVARELRE